MGLEPGDEVLLESPGYDPLRVVPEYLQCKVRELERLIEEGLQLRLRSSQASTKVSKRKIPVFKGRGGLVAGLNASSNKALLDAADNDA